MAGGKIRLAVLAMLLIGCGGAKKNVKEPMPDPLRGVGATALYKEGMAYGEHGDTIRAEQYISAAIKKGYDRREAMPHLVNMCVQGSRLNAALKHIEPYLEDYPKEWALRQLAATIYLGLDRPVPAQNHLERVIRDAPEQSVAYYLMGSLFRDYLLKPFEAVDFFKKYVELDPKGRYADEANLFIERPVIELRKIKKTSPASPPETETETEGDATVEDAKKVEDATKSANTEESS